MHDAIASMKRLSYLYAENIANGRFLWRNRVGAEAVEVQVKAGDQKWVFDAQEFFVARAWAERTQQLSELAQLVQNGFIYESDCFFECYGLCEVGDGAGSLSITGTSAR